MSFTAKEGEVTALVGSSGSGKSTCARMAAGAVGYFSRAANCDEFVRRLLQGYDTYAYRENRKLKMRVLGGI